MYVEGNRGLQELLHHCGCEERILFSGQIITLKVKDLTLSVLKYFLSQRDAFVFFNVGQFLK